MAVDIPKGAKGTSSADDKPFDLPPEKEAYYAGAGAADEHRAAMKGMTRQQRAQYMKGVREGMGGGNNSVGPPTPDEGALPDVAGKAGRGKGRGPKPRSSPRVPNPGRPSALRPLGKNIPVGIGPGMSLGGLLVGAVAYALLLSVVEYGSAGPGMWLRAKFLNEAGSSSSSTPKASPNNDANAPKGSNAINPPPVSGPTASNPTAPTVTPTFPLH